MGPKPVEQQNVSLVGYHDLNDRPGFKIALQNVGDRWYVYLGQFWHRGWSIVDVTDPENPELANFVEGPDNTTTKQIQVADGKMITGLERPSASGPAAGASTDPSDPYETGAYIWDVETDPTDPELLGHYETGGRGTHRNFYNGGDYVFMTASPEGFEPTLEDKSTKPVKNYHLRIVDISDPGNPTEVSTFMWPGQHPNDDSEEPKNRYFHGPAYTRDDRAYLSYGKVGMVTLDISDIENPELLYHLDFGGGLGGFNGVHSVIPIPGTDIAAVNSEAILEGSPLNHENGDPLGYTFLVDISDESPPDFTNVYHEGPRVVSSLPLPKPESHLPYKTYYEKTGRFGPHNQHHPRGESCRLHTDEYLVMTYFNAGIRIFDISTPVQPTEAGYYVPEDPERKLGENRPRDGLGTQLEDVAVDSRGYIYCTDPNRGLLILESDLL